MKVQEYKNIEDFLSDLVELKTLKNDYKKAIVNGEKYTHALDLCNLFFKTKREAIEYYYNLKREV